MIRSLLTRYHPRYPRSLTYLLQASEYDINAYFAWFRRVADFRTVEQRKQLVFTKKAVLILIGIWISQIALYALFAAALVMSDTALAQLVAAVLFLATPTLIGYAIPLPVALLTFVAQKPIELVLTRRARQKLRGMVAVKIGIAGSFGKTSMREILKTVLAEGKKVAAPPGSHNTVLGICRFIEGLQGDEEVIIFELGEYYPGDVRELCALVEPHVGVITGVNEAHLEKFKTIDKTVATIFELADFLGDKPLYINGENALAAARADEHALVYSRQGIKGMQVTAQTTGLEGTAFSLMINGTEERFSSQLLGLHQIGPLVAAIDIALSLGLPIESIRRGIGQTKPFAHRLEPRSELNGVVTLDDSYNGNPDGVRAVIDFLSALQGRRRFYVTPGLVEMGPKTAAVHQEIGRQLAEAGIEKVVLIKNSVTGFIATGLTESGFRGELIWFDDALKAFAALPHLTVSGDVVLLQNDLPDQYH